MQAIIKLDLQGSHISVNNNGPTSNRYGQAIIYLNTDDNDINPTGIEALKRAYPKTLEL